MNTKKEKILIVGPAWVGDMVMAQSLFRILKHKNPAIQIDVLAPAWTESLLQRMPEVRRSIAMPLGHGQLGLGARWKLGRSLRSYQYDRAIVLPRSLKSAIVPFVAKAKKRTGFLGEQRWFLLNDIRKLDKEGLTRTVDRFMALGLDANESVPDQIASPRLTIDSANADAAIDRLSLSRKAGLVIGFAPGAEYGPAKQWPVEHFAALARLLSDAGAQIWIFGSNKDTAAARLIQAKSGNVCIDITGKTNIPEAIDLLAHCGSVVTNDSGLMHLAAAAGTHVVAIYGSSDPGHTPPLSEKANVLWRSLDCSPCFQRVCPLGHTNCLKGIAPEEVFNVIKGSGILPGAQAPIL